MTVTKAISIVRARLRIYESNMLILYGDLPAQDERYLEALETLIAVATIVATAQPSGQREERGDQ